MVNCITGLHFLVLLLFPIKGLYMAASIDLAKWHALANQMWVGMAHLTSKWGLSEASLEFSPVFFHFLFATRIGLAHRTQNEKTGGAEPSRITAVASDIKKSEKHMFLVINPWDFRVVCYVAKLTLLLVRAEGFGGSQTLVQVPAMPSM